VETFFARKTRPVPLSAVQREVVIGALLGDACLMPTTAGWCLRISHGLRQQPYVDWKFQKITGYVRSAPRQCGRSYSFRTTTHPEFVGLRQDFYGSGVVKRVPIRLMHRELTALGLAVWFMDDGAWDGRQVRINTQGFSREENLELIGFLQAKIGVVATLNRDKDRFRLRIAGATMIGFVDLVEPYVIPSMLYKLPL
jgi:hypothetical protein